MTKLIYSLLLLLLLLPSCKDTWEEEDKVLFKKACMQDAVKWAGSDEKATTYCNCVLEKILVKYPHENDALDHMDSLAKDPTIQSCRDGIMQKKQ